MAYTEFRKFYGGFDVVIPAVNFSSLTREEAVASAERLTNYVDGFVCHLMGALPSDKTMSAGEVIQTMLVANGGEHHGEANLGVLVRKSLDLSDMYFRAFNTDGITLRKAWCKHMANEIEREFQL